MPKRTDELYRYEPGNPEPVLISRRGEDGKWDPIAPWELPEAKAQVGNDQG